MQIHVVNSDGNDMQAITSGSNFDANPDWSPNGSRIAFNSSRDDSAYGAEIHTINPDGSEVKMISKKQSTNPVWSPSGSYILYQADAGDYTSDDLYIMNLKGKLIQRLTDNTLGDYSADWILAD